ncbi:hypothetical protein NX059_012411 [Plenodomus lindquistii]|nr:hypothetical protein NX059_012411 [Plenodomus lindquistii]
MSNKRTRRDRLAGLVSSGDWTDDSEPETELVQSGLSPEEPVTGGSAQRTTKPETTARNGRKGSWNCGCRGFLLLFTAILAVVVSVVANYRQSPPCDYFCPCSTIPGAIERSSLQTPGNFTGLSAMVEQGRFLLGTLSDLPRDDIIDKHIRAVNSTVECIDCWRQQLADFMERGRDLLEQYRLEIETAIPQPVQCVHGYFCSKICPNSRASDATPTALSSSIKSGIVNIALETILQLYEQQEVTPISKNCDRLGNLIQFQHDTSVEATSFLEQRIPAGNRAVNETANQVIRTYLSSSRGLFEKWQAELAVVLQPTCARTQDGYTRVSERLQLRKQHTAQQDTPSEALHYVEDIWAWITSAAKVGKDGFDVTQRATM